jgi:hypothetical protein
MHAHRPANYYCRRQAAQIKNNRNANLLFGVERARSLAAVNLASFNFCDAASWIIELRRAATPANFAWFMANWCAVRAAPPVFVGVCVYVNS